jgi:hypothetical protein
MCPSASARKQNLMIPSVEQGPETVMPLTKRGSTPGDVSTQQPACVPRTMQSRSNGDFSRRLNAALKARTLEVASCEKNEKKEQEWLIQDSRIDDLFTEPGENPDCIPPAFAQAYSVA